MHGSLSYGLLLGIALKSTVVLAVAALTALALRGRSAALRHAAWSVAFTALLVLPLFVLALPALRVPITVHLPASGLIFRISSSTLIQPSSHEAAGRRIPAAVSLGPAAWPEGPGLLMILWAAGTALGFMQMLIGWIAICRLQRRAEPAILPELASLTEQFGITEHVKLWQTAPGSMPITFGLFRPAIFLPADAAEWRADRRRVVLLHELAHVRRGDTIAQLLARTALCLYWWNPLAWIGWREFVREREQAADDLVLGAGESASDYAGHLLEVARSMQSLSAVGHAAVPMARRSQLEGRLSAILDSNRDRGTPARKTLLATSLLALVLVAPPRVNTGTEQ